MMTEFHRKLITVSTLTLALVLASCSTTPESTGTPPKTVAATAPDPYADSQALIQRARKLPSPQSDVMLIEAANQLLELGKRREAKRLLLSIDTRTLPATAKVDKVLTLARIAIAQQKFNEATELLTTDTHGLLSASTDLDAVRLNRISLLRAQAWEAQENFLAAARERIFVAPMLEGTDVQQDNHRQIWQNLIQLPTETLDTLTRTIAIPEIQGWLELAWIYKGQQDDLDAQMKAIRSWQQRFADHPAARQLPDSVRLLTELASTKPQRIALLLPLQGKYRQSALAVQNGFLTAHYAALRKQDAGTPVPELRVYDSSDVTRFIETYQRAVREGADIIVGPLQKENVHQLATSPQTLPVTTIALNTDDSVREPPQNLFQFGLTPEDDAREVALQAQRDNHRRAGVFYQQSPWGERALAAFRDHWSQDGLAINTTTSFDSAKGLAAAVKQTLLVDQSEARAQQIKRVVGRNMEFQPRRRQDIDFLYLVGTPEQARLIKPLLNFYFAENLPVYASSQIYSGENNPEKDRDLDGVLFCDLPWMLEQPDSMKRRLLEAWPKTSPRFYRLNALGVDAYRLQTRIHLLKQVPGAGIFGATGSLSIGEQNRIQRGLAWATFKDGKPVPLPKIIDTAAMEDDGHRTPDRQTTQGQPGGNTGPTPSGTTGI